MSRSNNTEIQNPASKFIEWKGGKGILRYFDKSRGEKGEDVIIPLPFTFLVLDRLSTIKGFSDSDQSGFWSNEVRDLKKEPFTVRTKKGVVHTGLYSTMAPVLNMGACYSQSIYAAVKGADGKLEIVNIQMNGCAIGPWIELLKGKDIYKYAVTIASRSDEKKKGQTVYYEPVFKLNSQIAEETEKQAIELDKQLQEYLAAYFKRTSSQIVESTADQAAASTTSDLPNSNGNGEYQHANEITEPIDDLPF